MIPVVGIGAQRSRQFAGALLEFAILIPLLLIMLSGCVELYRLLQSRQIVSVSGRQIGNSAYRDCILTPVDVLECFEDTYNEYNDYFSEALPGSNYILSYYQYNESSGVVMREALYPPSLAGSTKFNTRPLALFNQKVQSIGPDNEEIVIVEVFFDHMTLGLPFSEYMFEKSLYSATIF